MDEGVNGQISTMLQALGTLPGVVGMLGLGLLLFLAFRFTWGRWLIIACLLYICSLAQYREKTFDVLITPLQQMRSYSRPLSAALLLILAATLLVSRFGWRRRVLSWATIFFFALEMLYVLRMSVGGDSGKSLLAAFTFSLAFVALGIGLAMWLQGTRDSAGLVRCVAFAGALFVFGVIAQFIVNRGPILIGGRLAGTTANPQHAAALLALSLIAVCYLVSRKGERGVMRLAWAGLAGLMAVFLIWTGSRTGALMSVVGMALLFRRHMGRALLAIAAIAAFALVGMQVFTDSGDLWNRVSGGDMTDSRSVAWRPLWDDFVSSPWIGVNEEEASSYSENSYLVVASRVGIVGLIPLLMAMVSGGVSLCQLARRRRFLGEHDDLLDYVTASLAAAATGALFEGYLVGVYVFPVFAIYVDLGLLTFLWDYADRAGQCQPLLEGTHHGAITPESARA